MTRCGLHIKSVKPMKSAPKSYLVSIHDFKINPNVGAPVKTGGK